MAQLFVRFGSKSVAVKYLQQSLTTLGYNPVQIDWIFGSKTNTAVRTFQKAKGLVVDGIVGTKTWVAIENTLKLIFTIKDYFPLKENTNYVYEGKGNEYASYNVVVDYINGNRIQLRTNNGGTELVQV